MSNGKGDVSPLVTVIMIAFNHEKYIRDAIESVLAQNTSFSFEIVIHDDASQDRTAEIAREFEKRYPSIIRTIVQQENQFSKGINILRRYIYPTCKGSFFAFCECDDYWCDPLKLEKQVRCLRDNSQYTAVYHNCYIVDEENREIDDYSGPYIDRAETTYDSVRLAVTGDYPGQTASSMVRASVFSLSEQEWDDFETIRVNGDKKILMLAASKGGIHVLNEKMSAHRVVYKGGSSWTAANYRKNMSGIVFRSNYDLRMYLKKHCPKVRYPNQYHLLHSGVAVLVKGIVHASEDDRQILNSVSRELGGIAKFAVYIIMMGIVGIPVKVFGRIAYR